MKIRRVLLASDHAGFALRQTVGRFLIKKGIKILDLGPQKMNSVDYPDFAHLLARKMRNNSNNFGCWFLLSIVRFGGIDGGR